MRSDLIRRPGDFSITETTRSRGWSRRPQQRSQLPTHLAIPADGPIIRHGSAFTMVASGVGFVATSTSNAKLQVEVDCDDETTDGRYFGVAPVLDGKRLQIAMWICHSQIA